MKSILLASSLVFTWMPAVAADFWDVMAIVTSKDGTNLRLEVDRASSLQECRNKAMVAYAHLHQGPIFCQHITHVDLIDVYGNVRPVE